MAQPFSYVVNSDDPTDEQQRQILELFILGNNARTIPGLMNYDVSSTAVDNTLREAMLKMIQNMEAERG